MTNGSLNAIVKANILDCGAAKAKQIHAVAGLFLLACSKGEPQEREMVAILAAGLGIEVDQIRELIFAADADIAAEQGRG